MQTQSEILEGITDLQRRRYLRDLRFPPVLEQEFRDDYDRKVLPGLRGGLLLLLFLFVSEGISAFALSHALVLPVWISSSAILILVLASLHPRFSALWQPAVVVTFCLFAWQLLGSLTHQHPPPSINGTSAIGSFRANTLLLNELLIVIVGFALTRLRFVWFTVGILTISALTILVAVKSAGVSLALFIGGTRIFVIPSFAALMFVAYLQERGARGEFLANYQLDQERADERRKREKTEGMLHVLSQAIGGIVHDLGNPLTSVRTGAETLRVLDREGDADEALTREILDIISDGALMLDYLRLSLLEQTRVLEGKPIPLQCEAVPIRRIIEAGTHYQKPNLTSGRKVSAVGEEVEIYADGMKLITVFMNLLGNALKYSDGEVRILWRQHRDLGDQDFLLCAVLDQGRSSVGVSSAQANQLFVAFGRLDAHDDVEGTGLGLLSAQKIVEAHGGEIFLEGYTDGTPFSVPFTTARRTYPPMLDGGFRTAFVVTCPIGPVDLVGEGCIRGGSMAQ